MVNIFKLRKGAIFDYDQIKEGNVIRNSNFQFFWFLTTLRLLIHVGVFRIRGLILSEVFWYMERRKNLEKEFHNRAKDPSS